MKEKILLLLRFLFQNFGPLIVFYGANHFWGLKLAILASILFCVGEISLTLSRGKKLSTLFKFSAVLTLLFGAVDLYANQSFLFKYEASVTNVLTGIFFAASIFSEKTILQGFYEQRKDARAVTSDLAAFFRFLTGVWVVYFFAKAAAYFWIAREFSIEQGLVIRSSIGSISFYILLAISIFGSKKIFLTLKGMGFFPQDDTQLAAVQISRDLTGAVIVNEPS